LSDEHILSLESSIPFWQGCQ